VSAAPGGLREIAGRSRLLQDPGSTADVRGTVAPGFEIVTRALALCVPSGAPGGAAVCVYHRGKCVVRLGMGTRNRRGDPFEPDTLALAFSTTKGVTATLLHVLVDRGEVALDAPVAGYWPEFARNGKSRITVRHVAAHQAGLHLIAPMIHSARDMLDWPTMIHAIEGSTPFHAPGADFAYHAFTFGWIIGEVLQRATGRSFSDLLQERLAAPLGLTGLYVGLPASALSRCAEFVGTPVHLDGFGRGMFDVLARVADAVHLRPSLHEAELALLPSGIGDLDLNDPSLLRAVIPSANGVFDAPSLARLYAALACGGMLEGTRLLSRGAIERASADQNGVFDRIIPFPLHVKLGYHRPVSLGIRCHVAGHRVDLGYPSASAFGHFGMGGSGAWADPERELSVGLVTNCFGGFLPLDLRTVAICTAAAAAVDRLRT
jgi:CubicO group peptidase (beta-lactamase class C family)